MRIIAQGQTPDDEGEDGDDEPGNGHDDDQTRDVDPWWTADIDWKEEEHPHTSPRARPRVRGGEFTKGAGASAARMAEIRGKEDRGQGRCGRATGGEGRGQGRCQGSQGGIVQGADDSPIEGRTLRGVDPAAIGAAAREDQG